VTPSGRIIVALDVPSERDALRLADQLAGAVGLFKVGLQLFTACGPSLIAALHERGAKVFLDLKFHDIPNTVAHAVESAAHLGVAMTTLHLSGGSAMCQAAAAAAATHPAPPLLLGVTVLTSSSEATLRETGVDSPVEPQVLRLAALGRAAGLRGLVASPLEIGPLRSAHGNGLTLVIPGVRPAGSDPGDQHRIMTPAAAVAAGADYLVIGRPITAAPSPRDAAEQIAASIG
jgi:orotidine-5'-phosphate decarboxylase